MHWQQKLQALNAIAEHHLIMREPGDWYVSSETMSKERGGCTLYSVYGNGPTPEDAVNDHWDKHTELTADQFIVATKYGKRMAVRWNGFMWDHIEERKPT